MGGKISVTSKLGEGTTFIIDMPIQTEPVKQHPKLEIESDMSHDLSSSESLDSEESYNFNGALSKQSALV